MPEQPFHEALAAPLAAFRARTPPRIWSLIVSFLGDAVLPRGGQVRAGVISEFCGLAGIEPGLVRTALSRLVAKGYLERSREGRASFYRLTEPERRAFAAAADLIYGRCLPEPDGKWQIALATSADQSSGLREMASRHRFQPVAPTVFLRPGHRGARKAEMPGLTVFEAGSPPGIGLLAGQLWPLADLAAAYQAFTESFGPLATLRLAPSDAVLGRVLLAHEFRRVLLRDPFLPREALPEPWLGPAARKVFDATHAALSPAAEAWLDAQE